MPKHLFFLKDPSLLGEQLAEQPVDATLAKVPEWVNVLPEPDADGLIFSRDNRVLHIDNMAKLAKRSNAALKKQKGGGLVDADHDAAMWGGAAIAWAEEFEARSGKGLWARADWLAAGEQLVGSKQYRYTSSVVTGEVEDVVDIEAWSVTTHIYPDTVDGFAITNIPALVTTSMFTEQPGRRAEELRLVLLKKLGLSADADNEAVKAAWLKRFTVAGETAGDAEAEDPPRNPETPAHPIDGSTPPLKKDDEDAEDTGETAGEPATPPPDPAAASELTIARTELAAARKRIAELEVEAGAAFVKQLLHSGKLTPAQRKAAEEQAKTPTGLAQLRALYEHAPAILPAGAAPVTPTAPATAPHGLASLSYNLAQQGKPLHEIVSQLQQRNKENR